MIFDPIAYSVAMIRARASRTAAGSTTAGAAKPPAGKTTATTPAPAKKKQSVAIPPLPRSHDRKPVISERQSCLASIKAPFLRKAAQALGTDIRFGLDARQWIDRNPHIRDMLPAITTLADELERSFRLTESVQGMPLPAPEPIPPTAVADVPEDPA